MHLTVQQDSKQATIRLLNYRTQHCTCAFDRSKQTMLKSNQSRVSTISQRQGLPNKGRTMQVIDEIQNNVSKLLQVITCMDGYLALGLDSTTARSHQAEENQRESHTRIYSFHKLCMHMILSCMNGSCHAVLSNCPLSVTQWPNFYNLASPCINCTCIWDSACNHPGLVGTAAMPQLARPTSSDSCLGTPTLPAQI